MQRGELAGCADRPSQQGDGCTGTTRLRTSRSCWTPSSVNGVAANGTNWQAGRTSSRPVIAAVKGLIRHDIDLQQIFADFAPQLLEA